MEFYWIISLILIPLCVIIPVGLIIIALYERKQKKSSKMKAKSLGAEKRLKGKGVANGFVACSDCGRLCNPEQMSAFGYWTTTSLIGDWGIGILFENLTFEEIIPDKKPKHTYSLVKDVCPFCADRLRTERKIYNQEITIVIIVIFIFIFVVLLKALPNIWFYMKNLF